MRVAFTSQPSWLQLVRKMPQHTPEYEKRSLSSFFFPSRLREDTWVELKQLCSNLIFADPNPDNQLIAQISERLDKLDKVESYWGFPGRENFEGLLTLFKEGHYQRFSSLIVGQIVPTITNQAYRKSRNMLDISEWETNINSASSFHQLEDDPNENGPKGYFEVLIVDRDLESGKALRKSFTQDFRRPGDPFLYEVLTVESFEDAVCAILFNSTIQTVVVRSSFAFKTRCPLSHMHEAVSPFLRKYRDISTDETSSLREQEGRTLLLAQVIKEIRPELDVFSFSDLPVERVALAHHSEFRRVFYNEGGDAQELHLCILQGITDRYSTPFFSALKSYSRNPTGVFHALPISRCSSLNHSHWIKDMLHFYGRNIFLAETSSTCGGLDSLLEPHGPIKQGQELAATTFGSDRSYWVTNGTSTANKIVVQGLIRPGDIVLVDRNCHKSHHLGLCLVGGHVIYLEAYGLQEYAIYGAVPLRTIKKALLDLKKDGKLHLAKMILLDRKSVV